MTRNHVARRGGAVLAALLLTTACLPDGDSGGDDEETSESLPKGGQQLTEEEISSVLPGEDEVPQEMGRVDEDDGSARDPETSFYPKTCRDVEFDGEAGTALDEHQTAKAAQGYTGAYGGAVKVTVASYDEVVPGELFDAAGAAQETCTEFSKTNTYGTTKWKLTPATIKPMGERTYIANLEVLSGDESVKGRTSQIAGVTIGHNLVLIAYSAGPKSNLSTQVVEELAQTTVDNLEAL
ncbi:MAG TPA: hypothetical protein H9805_09205 [Candidatus Janibacter merdipullorum]|nr:hypothetical protein [Candidatus Janibacter merdipullorum]